MIYIYIYIFKIYFIISPAEDMITAKPIKNMRNIKGVIGCPFSTSLYDSLGS